MAAHVFNLELQLLLRPLLRALKQFVSFHMRSIATFNPTLKARCSRKCAVPLVVSVSALLPASIHTPTVEVWAHDECSVAICGYNQLLSTA